MDKRQKWVEWIKNLPTWVSGAIGLATAVISFMVLFQKNYYLGTIILGVLLLVAMLCLCLYLAFAKTPPLVEGGEGIYRFENYRPWALVGMGLIFVVIGATLALKPSRSFIATAFVGTVTPTSTPTPTPSCPGGIGDNNQLLLVLIAPFEHRGGEERSPHSYISDRLANELFGSDILIKSVSEPLKNEVEAEALGQNCGAALVIWGWYDKTGISPHIEPMEPVASVCYQESIVKLRPVAALPSDLDSYVMFIVYELPDTMAYFLHSISAYIQYSSSNYDDAVTSFTRALELDIPLERRERPDLLYFYRGNAYYELGNFQAASEDWNSAITLNPEFIGAYI